MFKWIFSFIYKILWCIFGFWNSMQASTRKKEFQVDFHFKFYKEGIFFQTGEIFEFSLKSWIPGRFFIGILSRVLFNCNYEFEILTFGEELQLVKWIFLFRYEILLCIFSSWNSRDASTCKKEFQVDFNLESYNEGILLQTWKIFEFSLKFWILEFQVAFWLEFHKGCNLNVIMNLEFSLLEKSYKWSNGYMDFCTLKLLLEKVATFFVL